MIINDYDISIQKLQNKLFKCPKCLEIKNYNNFDFKYNNVNIVRGFLKSSIYFNYAKMIIGEDFHLWCNDCYKPFIIIMEKFKDEARYIKSLTRDFMKRYKINLYRYNEIYKDQDGCCSICKKSFFRLIDKKTDNLHHTECLFVDHCHELNIVRGLLCNKCNIILGKYDHKMNNIIFNKNKNLNEFMNYLIKHKCTENHLEDQEDYLVAIVRLEEKNPRIPYEKIRKEVGLS